MRRFVAIAVGAFVAAMLAHGLTCAAMRSAGPPPADAYDRFFHSALGLIELLWSRVRGWRPLAGIQVFGHWLPAAVPVGCAVIGFVLFRLLANVRVGRHLWRPAAVLVAFLLAGPFPAREPSHAIGMSLLVFAVMICSVAAVRATADR